MMRPITQLFGLKRLLPAFALLCLAQLATAQPLTGSYTIGGASPDYATVAAAFADLETNGVSGPVTFNLRTGTYTEHVSLGAVAGTSPANRVVFQAETGDSTDVELTYTATSAADAYTVRLNNADYITFQHLTMTNTATVSTAVLHIDSGSVGTEVLHCVFSGPQGYYWDQYAANIYSGSTVGDDSTTIMNCRFMHNAAGIHLRGTYFSGHESHHVINNNHFVGQSRYGLQLYAVDGVEASGNTVEGSYDFTALDFTFIGDTMLVTKNKLLLDSMGGRGLSFNAADVAYGLVANNFVHVDAAGYSSRTAMYLTSSGGNYGGGNRLDIVNNTFLVHGIEPFYDACIFSQFNNENQSIHLVNNLFYAQNAEALHLVDTNSFGTIDYNGYWTTGPNMLNWGDTHAAGTLAEMQAVHGKDANSIEAEPIFSTWGQPQLVAGAGYDGGATPWAMVTEDCEGDVRDGATPDIGADEFTANYTEMNLLEFQEPGPVCGDTAHIYVQVQNAGSGSADSTKLGWSLNGAAQAPVNHQTPIAPGATGTIYLGAVPVTPGSVYAVTAWLTSGGGLPTNDSAATTFGVALPAGSYTVGGASPDFATLTDAAAALTNGGVCGAVVFNVRPGTYNEQVYIGQIAGVSASNTVTFQSETLDSAAVTVTHTAGSPTDNYVWKLHGSDYVTLQHLSLVANGSTYAHGLVLENGASQLTVNNCYLRSDSITYQNTEAQLIYAKGAFHHDVAIHHNLLHLGNAGVHIEDAFSNPSGAEDLHIHHNTFLNNGYHGISLQYLKAPVVEYNLITGKNPTAGYNGMYLYSLQGPTVVASNEVYLEQGQAQYGINLFACEGTETERILVANNAISIPNQSIGAFALEIGSSSTEVDTYHNSVWLRANAGGMPSSAALEVWAHGSRVYNNVVYAEDAYAFKLFFNTVLDSADNNSYYSKNGTSIYCNFADQTLASYQALTGWEAQTDTVHPKFVAWNNLRTNAAELDDSGSTVPGLPTDLEGTARNMAAPDLGAFEFTHVPFVCGQPTNLRAQQVQDVTAILQWNGPAEATAYRIFLRAAGSPDWDTIHLKQNDQTFWFVGGLTPGTTYKWTVSARCGAQCVWSEPANPWERFVTLTAPCTNPSALSTSPVGVDKARLNFTPAANAWQTEIRWREQGGSWQLVTKDPAKDTHWLSGLSAATTYEWQIRTKCRPDNTSNTTGSAIQQFTTAPSSKQLETSSTLVVEPTMMLFPNPATNKLSIYVAHPAASGDVEVRLFDATGKMVRAQRSTLMQGETTIQLDVSDLPRGIYLVRSNGAAQFTERLVVE